MLHLSRHTPISLRKISMEEKIPERFLEQVFLKLKKANLVKGKRGAGGGYALTREKEKINWLNIMEAVDERLTPVPCMGPMPEECPTFNECLVRKYWKEFYEFTREFFSELTLDIK